MDEFLDFSSSGSGVPDENSTLSTICAADSLQVTNTSRFSTPLSTAVVVFQAVYGLFLIVFGTVLNVLIMFLILKYRKLKTVTFSIAFQICLAHLVSVMSFSIPIFVSNIARRWVFGYIVCIMTAFLTTLFGILRSFLILVFFVDLFLFVFTPFQYRKYSFKSTVAMCIICWFFSAAVALIFLPGILDCYAYTEPLMYCIVSARCSNCGLPLRVLSSSIFFTTTAAAVGLMIPLYLKRRKLNKSSQPAQEKNLKDVVVEELKALNTFSCLFAAALVVIIPPLIDAFAVRLFGSTAGTLALIMAADILASIAILDPLIILKNQNVKDILKQMRRNIFK